MSQSGATEGDRPSSALARTSRRDRAAPRDAPADPAALRARPVPVANPLPPITFPESLPVSARRDEISQAIADHQVVIVCGETGSGKTTQLPKIALQLGRGRGAGGSGLIGHTQPRRIAASSVAKRIAQELGHAARRACRLQGALPGPAVARRERQADDRRHPAGRDADRSAAARLRHADHRRGARAQPEHRLPARLPAPDPAAPARPEADRHLGDDRCRPLRPPLRLGPGTGAGDPGVGPPLPGRAALPPVRGKPRVRPERRDRRCGRRALARSARRRRRARLPARRARDPRRRRGAAPAPSARRRRAAAVRAPEPGRAGPHLRAARRAAHRAGDQRGRDLADGARHPVRDRRRHRARQALQLPQQGRAAADRAGQPGGGQPARRPLRPGQRRHLHPALRREGFHRAAALHRPGDPALVAGRRDPAHACARPGQRRGLSVHRGAAAARDLRRLPAAQRARCGRRAERADRRSGASWRACRSIRASAA